MNLKEILADLLSLEVNTIIKDNMAGTKMPALPFALIDILAMYCATLREFGLNLEPYFELDRDRLWLALDEQAKGGEPRAKKLVDEAERAYHRAHGRAPAARSELFNYLTDLWPVLEQPKLPPPSDRRFAMDEVDNGWDNFERVRIAANQALDFGSFTEADRVLLSRIVGNCSRLKFIVQGISRNLEPWSDLIPMTRNRLLMSEMHNRVMPLDKLATQHQATVRKIWEIGTERIVAQTYIQIDGDVLTRISPSLLEQQNEAIRDMIIDAHREGIGTSLSYWKHLVEVATQLSKLLLGRR
ncbi:MAG: hypothetical protein R6X02_29375 [Enhygromyxa sp.]